MKAVIRHIEHIHGKPHHVRKQIAFTAAFAGAALIAVIWFTVSMSTGVFAIHINSEGTTGPAPTLVTEGEGKSGLAGAAAALESDADEGEARIEIVDTTPKASPKKAEQTTIPF